MKKAVLAAIMAGVFVAAIVIVGAVLLAPKEPGSTDRPITLPANQTTTSVTNSSIIAIDESKYGAYNSEHVHAAFMMVVEGKQIDFSDSKYQLKSRFIHFENNDGTTLHRHAKGVPFGDFLKSVGMDIVGRCLLLGDGSKHCDQDGSRLRFFLNRTEISSIVDYVIQDKDRLLIIYGNETDAQIESRLADLQERTIITVN